MNRPEAISVFSDQRRTKSTIWSRVSCGTQTQSSRDVLRHQFRQDLILGLDLLLQIGDPLLLCGMVGPRFRLKGSRAVVEELLLPGVEDRGLESLFVTAPRSAPAPADASLGWQLSLPACSASVASSMRSLHYLNGGTLLHFQLNRNSLNPEFSV